MKSNPIVNESQTYNNGEIRFRANKTFQDSNIFGAKDNAAITITQNAREEQSKNQKVRNNPTFTSNVFNGGETFTQKKTDPAGSYNRPPPVQRNKIVDHTTEEIFGKYNSLEGDAFRKEKGVSFEPKYVVENPKNLKSREFYGTDYNPNQGLGEENVRTSVREVEFSKEKSSALQKKMKEQESDIFSSGDSKYANISASKSKDLKSYAANTMWSDLATRTDERGLNLKDTNPKFAHDKKKNEMQSTVFEHVQDGSARAKANDDEKPAEFFDSKNADKRKNNRNYSDLNDFEAPDVNRPKEKHQIASVASWNEFDSQKLDPFKHQKSKEPQLNAFEQKRKLLSSEFDTHEFKGTVNPKKEKAVEPGKEFKLERSVDTHSLKQKELRSSINGYDPTGAYEGSAKENLNAYDLDVKGVNAKFDSNSLKRYCFEKGLQVIECNLSSSITNPSSAEGKIRIKAKGDEDVEKLRNDLSKEGVTFGNTKDNFEKKRNFASTQGVDWKNPKLEMEEKRYEKKFENCKISKMRELESHGEMFGSGEGVGQWGTEWKQSKVEEARRPKSAMKEISTKEDVVKAGNWKNSIKKVGQKKFTPVLAAKHQEEGRPSSARNVGIQSNVSYKGRK